MNQEEILLNLEKLSQERELAETYGDIGRVLEIDQEITEENDKLNYDEGE